MGRRGLGRKMMLDAAEADVYDGRTRRHIGGVGCVGERWCFRV